MAHSYRHSRGACARAGGVAGIHNSKEKMENKVTLKTNSYI